MNHRLMLPILFLVGIFLISACKNDNSTTGSEAENVSRAEDALSMLKTFPFQNLEDLVENIPADEWQQLMSDRQSQQWSVKEASGTSIVIENKISVDNFVRFSLFKGSEQIPVIVQQYNGSVAVTDYWQFSTANNEWQTMSLPDVPLSDFLAENVSLPEEYNITSTYLDIAVGKDSLVYTINKWLLMREIAAVYEVAPDDLYNSYVKYYFVLSWNGEKFDRTVRIDSEYDEVLKVKATVQQEDPDGPGITYFDCPHGVSVTASSTLAAQGSNSYVVNNLLDDSNESAWAEGKADSGIGEWIEFTVIENYLIGSTYQIKPGYSKSANSWKANNRVKQMRAFVNDEPVAVVTFEDVNGYHGFSIIPSWKNVELIKKGDRIRFVIEQVYPGEKYNDTVISYFVPTGNCG